MGRDPGPRHPTEHRPRAVATAPALRCHDQDSARGGRSITRYCPRSPPLPGRSMAGRSWSQNARLRATTTPGTWISWPGMEGRGRRRSSTSRLGRSIGAGWLQVGGYLSLSRHGAAVPAQLMSNGGILHVPRVAVSKEPKAVLEIRDGGSLLLAWAAARERFNAVLAGATPLRSPGQHCGRCAANCPVRI